MQFVPVVSTPTLSAAVSSTSQLEIDLGRIAANVAAWREWIGPAKFCAVVKADAYSLGAVRIAQCVQGAGADMLAVFSPDQAMRLLEADVRLPILVMMAVSALAPEERWVEPLREGRVHLAIHDLEQLHAVELLGRRAGAVLPVHLYLDTGMSRGGLDLGQFAAALHELRASKSTALAAIYTHFTSADQSEPLMREQEAILDRAVAEHRALIPRGVMLHTANTCAAARASTFHHAMVRVGQGLYGVGPAPESRLRLRAAVRWTSALVQLFDRPAGATVGYGRTCILQRDSKLAVVPVGYADGYPVSLGNAAAVKINRQPAPVLGAVNMDQLVVDVTDITGELTVGSEVVLIDDEADSWCSLPRLAQITDTCCHEILCRLSPRVARLYRSAK